METFHQKFTIHPVGQGLFYSCIIKHNSQVKFRMVFDCGSNTAKVCKDEVSIYKDCNYLEQKILDLLVISHFDSDHVNCIGLLLDNKIKVRRLVMPMITFEERLFLVARYLKRSNGFKDKDDFTVRFIIDPIGTISNNLDDDSEIYFIYGTPNTPIPFLNDSPSESNRDLKSEKRLTFDFDHFVKEEFDVEKNIITSLPSKGRVYKVSDINTGKLRDSMHLYKLMEFLFYKRSVGINEEVFFKEVESQFYQKFEIDSFQPINAKLNATIEKVKKINSSIAIKAIFKDAAKKVRLQTHKGIMINDLNTTALCLLHRNLTGIFDFINLNRLHRRIYHHHGSIRCFQKFKQPSSRLETIAMREANYALNYRPWLYEERFIYPNVLLTSDTFLLTNEEVEVFLNKYQNYWSDFWLFQIPHHGSNNSSNRILHSNIPGHCFNFINYGIGNRDGHPSEGVVIDLLSTGNSSRVVPVNQVSGLVFEFFA